MYVDLLNSNNYISINISLIQLIGLRGAVYISELLNILKKAIIKKKLIDDAYIKVNRNYISDRTTITKEEQYDIDKQLKSLDLITNYQTDKDTISIDIAGIVAMIAESDKKSEQETITAIKNVFNTKTKSELIRIKSKAVSRALKKSIGASYSEKIRNALYDWIDTIISSTSLSKKEVIEFQNKLLSYSTDEMIILKIIDIATIHKYSSIDLAIRKYEQKTATAPRCTTQRRATKEEFMKGEAF